ncbi:GAF domain-containing protein [Microcoleus vaginatus PCC 9802]|uniref:GAF domain-containing protein n=1 Tax=Microcoleus vaginatus TaxID=119532 RepID=UPI00020D2A21|nr:multi-sensor hybrid histidine kinase [Microcoleus vaginatus FGP-2]UNU18460.1 GAF domain-containing protein [Microcoleus vaginatus PCC 9802]
MWESLKNIFSPTQYMPHGHCYLWQTPLVWLHVTGDFLMAIAYYSIAAMLIYFIFKRRDVPFLGIFALFGAFIVLCGTGHLLEIWTLWHSAYWLSGIEKGITALVSCYTAASMVTVLPQLLSLKTPQDLETINRKLQCEIAVREDAELALRCAYDDLEVKVEERTAELRQINGYLEGEIREKIAAESALRERETRLTEQQNGLLELAKNSSIYEGNISEALREITQMATRTLNVERASIWFYQEDKSGMCCADLYELTPHQHSKDAQLKVADYPSYFQALNTEQPIAVVDAKTDPRTQEFSESYLIPLNISSMLDVPISHQGQIAGVICLEHQGTLRNWTLDEQSFASYVAQIAALAMEARDRKQAELNLRSVTERLQYLLATTPAVIFSCKLGGNYDVTFVSDNIVSIMGYEAREFLDGSLDWHSLIHPEDREIVATSFAKLLEKESISYEYRERHKDGSYRWIYDEIKLVKNAAGLPVECVGYGVDVTARKQAEIALQQQVKRERLVNSIQERIRSSLNLEEVLAMAVEEVRQFLSTDRTVIYRFNPDWSGFIAVESIAVGTMPILGIDINDPCFRERYVSVYEQGHVRAIDNIYTAGISECHLNLLRELEIKANLVVPLLQGEKLWGLLIAHHCRSQRHWNSSEIESLQQISVQLTIAIQQSTLFEQAKTELAERKLAETALQKAVVAADTANRAKSEFLSSMSHELRTPLNAILGFSQVMVRDSSLNNQHLQHLEIINRAGEHLLALINDILEMSKIEAGRSQLNESSFNLMRLLKTLEEMFRLKAKSKKLQLNLEVGDGVPDFVSGDEGKLRQILINLVGNAIKFTEMGSVTLRVKKKVEKSLGAETAEFSDTQTKLVGAGCEHSESLAVETAAIQRKPGWCTGFNQSESLAHCDCVDAHDLHPEVLRLQFEIEDTGLGIAAEEMNKLFEPFEQTKTGQKSQQGTGLGLPISRKFVQMMGGDITVSSTPELGSKFAFDIQISLAAPSEIKILKPQKKVISLAPNQPEYRILVVDDRADNCLVIDRLLSPLGILVREARDGQEAIAVWEDWQPHLIWMDMQMPVMDGYEATRKIKAHPLGKQTVIVALTASAFEEERQTILGAGCDDFMRKPFEAKILFAKMEELLGVRYLYEESVEAPLENESEISGVTSNQSVELQLGQMPPEWVEKISHAAHECCDDKILKLIEELPREFAVAAQVLTTLVDDFLFDDIIELAQSALMMIRVPVSN